MKTKTHSGPKSSRLGFALGFLSLLVAQAAWAWPNLKVVKSGPGQAAPGDLINYTLAYSNSGPVSGASVALKDFLPAYVTVLTNTLNGGTLSGNTITWNLGTLASRAGGSRSFQVRVNTNNPSGWSITNRAQIFGSAAEEPGKTNDNYSTLITRITNRPPTALNEAYSVNEDTTLTISAPGVLANDSDPDGNSLKAILVGGPTHGALTLNTNGSFSYRPATNYSGSDAFTYRANDGITNSAIATVSITVIPVNNPPVAANDSYTTPEATTLNVTAPGVLGNDSDLDGDALRAILVSGPTHGILTLNTNGGFTYTPAYNYAGADSFTYKVNDGTANSGAATAYITVAPVNERPAARNDSYTTSEDTALSIPAPGVLANDSDPDGDVLIARLASNPSHGTLTFNTNGSFTYVPAAHFTGQDSFTYLAFDGETNATLIATVAITVTPVNDPPNAADDSYTVNEDATLSVPMPGLLANDSDPDGDALTALLDSSPSHGTLTFGTNGNFTYRPALNYAGSDSFTYRAFDGQTNSNIATVRFTINSVNDRPVAANDSYTTPEDTVLSVPAPGVLANDSDPDGDVLIARLASSPQHGTLTFGTNGSFTYVPTPHFVGRDSFTYLTFDAEANATLIANVAITVNARPTVNISNPTNGAVFIAPANFKLIADAQDVDGTISRVEFFESTDRLQEVTSDQAPWIAWTNLPVGNYTFTAVATDNLGAQATSAPVSITVIQHPPLITLIPLHYNPLTGYFEERVRILNPTSSTFDAVRVSVFNLTNTPPISVHNLTGFTNGIPYLQSYAEVRPNGYVDMTIEYYSPLGIMPNPILRPELLFPRQPAPATLPGTQQHISQGQPSINGTFQLEFATLFNRIYLVQYSPDLVHWKSAEPTVTGNGGLVQWIDDGPPKTDSAPMTQSMRFYRVFLLP